MQCYSHQSQVLDCRSWTLRPVSGSDVLLSYMFNSYKKSFLDLVCPLFGHDANDASFKMLMFSQSLQVRCLFYLFLFYKLGAFF